MACHAPALWVSILLIVIGVVIAVLAVLPFFLVPDAVEESVIESAVIESEKDDGFKDFRDQTENPLIFNCYFWNITNAEQVKGGARPVMAPVGPYVWKKFAHRINITFAADKKTFSYREWNEYIYDEGLSVAGGNPEVDSVNTINSAWFVGLASRGSSEQGVAANAANSALAGLNAGLADPRLRVNFLNNAWANAMRGYVLLPAPFGVNGNYAALQALFAANTLGPTFPWVDTTNTLQELASNASREASFFRLFNTTVSGSLTDISVAGAASWMNATSKVPELISAFGLTPTEAGNIMGWRSVVTNPTTLAAKRLADNGGPGYGAVLAGVNGPAPGYEFSSKGLIPAAVNPADDTTWAALEDNIGFLHYGYFNSEGRVDYGIFANSSLIDLDPSLRVRLFAITPELGFFVGRTMSNVFLPEFTTAQPSSGNASIILSASPLSAAEARWVTGTFGNANFPPNSTTSIGTLTTLSFVSFWPAFLANSYTTLYTTRNFEAIAAVFNETAFPTQFQNFVNVAGTATFGPNWGNTLRAFGLLSISTLDFPKLYQIYFYLKYQMMGSFATAAITVTNSGPIIRATPYDWMFGKLERFFNVSVPGIWTDSSLELSLQNSFIETYMTGVDDVKNFRRQLTYEGNSSLARFFPQANPAPIVEGSSLTFIGPYRLISKYGEKKADESSPTFQLWVPDVVRDLQLIYKEEVSLFDITLYRFRANPEYKTVVQSATYGNPYDFVMNNRYRNGRGVYDFYVTFPYFTLVKDVEQFNGKLDGVVQDDDKWILIWDFEPITGLAMRASAPLQLSFPVKHDAAFGSLFNVWSANLPSNTTIPAWYIVRTNQITKDQADDWKSLVGAAIGLQVGLTAAMAAVGGILFIVGVALLIWRLVAGKPGEMSEFELRN